jgi:hypothetical protein
MDTEKIIKDLLEPIIIKGKSKFGSIREMLKAAKIPQSTYYRWIRMEKPTLPKLDTIKRLSDSVNKK